MEQVIFGLVILAAIIAILWDIVCKPGQQKNLPRYDVRLDRDHMRCCSEGRAHQQADREARGNG